jgi:hypothetical protein
MLASFSAVENISLGSTAKLCVMPMDASWISLFFFRELPQIALLLRGRRFIRDSRMGCLHQDYLYLVTTRTLTQYLWQRLMPEVPPMVQGMCTIFTILSFELRLNAPSASSLNDGEEFLRSTMPKNVSLKKAVALVVSLARLHNFCIDKKQLQIENMTARDERYIERLGAVPLEKDARTSVMFSI